MIWYDTGVVLKLCPVLAFDEYAERSLTLFEQTHEIVKQHDGAKVVMKEFPRTGGLLQQDAHEHETMEYIAAVYRQVIKERARRKAK